MLDFNFPTEPIGGGNPYSRCVSCKRSVPEINGELENHSEWCEYRKMVAQKDKIEWLRFLLNTVFEELPTNRDWLDPDIYEAIKEEVNGEGNTRTRRGIL